MAKRCPHAARCRPHAIASVHLVVQPTTPAYPLALMGFLWIALALLSRRWSRLGRLTAVAIGGLVILGGLALPYLVGGMENMMLAAPLIGGTIPVLGGFYQTLRRASMLDPPSTR